MVPHPATEPCGTIFFLCERSDDSKKKENSIFLKGIGWNEKEGLQLGEILFEGPSLVISPTFSITRVEVLLYKK
jgi:hypothetical protein